MLSRIFRKDIFLLNQPHSSVQQVNFFETIIYNIQIYQIHISHAIITQRPYEKSTVHYSDGWLRMTGWMKRGAWLSE